MREPKTSRKAAARRLAEAGCTVHEIAAITEHTTLKEVERYTKAVDRERLARSAMARMAVRQGSVTLLSSMLMIVSASISVFEAL